MSTIGIDFGTTNTRLAYKERNRGDSLWLVPPDSPVRSVASLNAYGQSDIVVHAKRDLQSKRIPRATWHRATAGVTKLRGVYAYPGEETPDLQDEYWALDESPSDGNRDRARLAAIHILGELLDRFRQSAGRPPQDTDQFVLGCPAGESLLDYPPLLADMAREAGWPLTSTNTLVLAEPIGVALSLPRAPSRREHVVGIIDVGGGTTDLAVVRIASAAEGMHYTPTQADHLRVGGADVDKWLLQQLKEKDSLSYVRVVEQAKISCSITGEPTLVANTSTFLTTAMLSEAVENTIMQALASGDISPRVFAGAHILLAGGMATIPGLREALAKFFHQPIDVADNPAYATAVGFANLWDDDRELTQAPDRALGYWDPGTRTIAKWIPAFQPLPASANQAPAVAANPEGGPLALFVRSLDHWQPAGVVETEGATQVVPYWDEAAGLAFAAAPPIRGHDRPLTWRRDATIPYLARGMPVAFTKNVLSQYPAGRGVIEQIFVDDSTVDDWVGDASKVTVHLRYHGQSLIIVRTATQHWFRLKVPRRQASHLTTRDLDKLATEPLQDFAPPAAKPAARSARLIALSRAIRQVASDVRRAEARWARWRGESPDGGHSASG